MGSRNEDNTLLILCNFVEHMLLICLRIPFVTGFFRFSSIKVTDILTVLTVLKIAKGWLQYLFTVKFRQVVEVVSLDDMHSENIWFTW